MLDVFCTLHTVQTTKAALTVPASYISDCLEAKNDGSQSVNLTNIFRSRPKLESTASLLEVSNHIYQVLKAFSDIDPIIVNSCILRHTVH